MRISKTKKSVKLNRSIGDRILLGALSIMVGLFSGVGFWFFTVMEKPAENLVEYVMLYSIRDAFGGMFLLCCLALLWSVAAPRWIENLLEHHALKAYGSVILAIPVVLASLWLIRNYAL